MLGQWRERKSVREYEGKGIHSDCSCSIHPVGIIEFKTNHRSNVYELIIYIDRYVAKLCTQNKRPSFHWPSSIFFCLVSAIAAHTHTPVDITKAAMRRWRNETYLENEKRNLYKTLGKIWREREIEIETGRQDNLVHPLEKAPKNKK